MSEFNQKAYEMFAQPMVQALSSESSAEIGRQLHPMRLEQSVMSDRNPWLAWLGPMAAAVRAARQPAAESSQFKQAERAASECISASLDYYRDLRDAASEAQFFQTFGVMFPALQPAQPKRAETRAKAQPSDPRQQPTVREALDSIEQGGYAEALARTACLLARKGEPLPLARFELKGQLAREYAALLPPLAAQEWRAIRGRQEAICRHEPDRAVETLPKLLASAEDRARCLTLLERLLADPRVSATRATPAQRAMLQRIREVLAAGSTAAAPARKRGKVKARTRSQATPRRAAAAH
jgi:hypothetical protein